MASPADSPRGDVPHDTSTDVDQETFSSYTESNWDKEISWSLGIDQSQGNEPYDSTLQNCLTLVNGLGPQLHAIIWEIMKNVSKNLLSSKSPEEIKDTLKCPLCKELVIEAVSLNCSHSLCNYCVTHWLKVSSGCPICKTAVSLKVKNQFIDAIIDLVLDFALADYQKKERQQRIQLRNHSQGQRSSLKNLLCWLFPFCRQRKRVTGRISHQGMNLRLPGDLCQKIIPVLATVSLFEEFGFHPEGKLQLDDVNNQEEEKERLRNLIKLYYYDAQSLLDQLRYLELQDTSLKFST